MESATRSLARFVSGLAFEGLPAEVVHEAKREILDIVGCAMAAYPSEVGRISTNLVKELGGVPEATVIGSGDKTSCVNAAYVNARMANALDADDMFYKVGHFAQSAVAAALALCERRSASGKDLITAAVAGFEIAARVGLGAAGPVSVSHGGKGSRSHSAGLTMMMAAAGASAKALGLDIERAYHTLCIAGAYVPAPTFRKHTENTGPLPLFKYGDAGWCAQAGVTAALLAEKGATGLPDILDGESGVLVGLGNAIESIDSNAMTAGFGKKWHLLETSYKPWPSCRLTHHPLTAFSLIMAENHLDWREIERVVVRGDRMTTGVRFRQQQPAGMVSSQFSHPHSIAMMALGIKRHLWHSPDIAADPLVREFRSRVIVEADTEHPQTTAGSARSVWAPASVEVVARGQTFNRSALQAKGDPFEKATYFTDEELADKFREMAMALGADSRWRRRVEKIVSTTYGLERVRQVAELSRLMSRQSNV